MLFDEAFPDIQNLNILIIGVGGVGGHCLDALHRSGISNITIVDFDTYDITNQNRQIGSENLGYSKVKTLCEKYSEIKGIDTKITTEWVENFDFEPFDFIVDAIDDVTPKCRLIIKCHKKLISSMGSAKRIDSTKVEITKLSKTFNDPLAKKVRDELRKQKFNKDVNVVFSPETPIVKSKGSFIGVTGSFGLACASFIIQKTISKYKSSQKDR